MSVFGEHGSVHSITYPHKLPSSSLASKLLRPLGPLRVFTFLAVTALSRFSSLSGDSFSFLLTDSSPSLYYKWVPAFLHPFSLPTESYRPHTNRQSSGEQSHPDLYIHLLSDHFHPGVPVYQDRSDLNICLFFQTFPHPVPLPLPQLRAPACSSCSFQNLFVILDSSFHLTLPSLSHQPCSVGLSPISVSSPCQCHCLT